MRMLKRFQGQEFFDFAFSGDYQSLLVASSACILIYETENYSHLATYKRLLKIPVSGLKHPTFLPKTRRIHFLSPDTFIVSSQHNYQILQFRKQLHEGNYIARSSKNSIRKVRLKSLATEKTLKSCYSIFFDKYNAADSHHHDCKRRFLIADPKNSGLLLREFGMN